MALAPRKVSVGLHPQFLVCMQILIALQRICFVLSLYVQLSVIVTDWPGFIFSFFIKICKEICSLHRLPCTLARQWFWFRENWKLSNIFILKISTFPFLRCGWEIWDNLTLNLWFLLCRSLWYIGEIYAWYTVTFKYIEVSIFYCVEPAPKKSSMFKDSRSTKPQMKNICFKHCSGLFLICTWECNCDFQRHVTTWTLETS